MSASDISEILGSPMQLLLTAAPVLLLLWGKHLLLFLWGKHRAKYDCPESLKSLPEMKGGYPTWLGVLGGWTLKLKTPKLYTYFPQWTKEMEYSDFRFFWLGIHIHMLTDPADINYILQNRPTMFRRSERLQSVFKSAGLGGNVFTEEAPEWGPVRRLVSPPFSAQNVASMLPSVLVVHERFIAKWREFAVRGASVEVKESAMDYTVGVVCLVGFDHDMRSFLPDFDVKMSRAVHLYFVVIAKLLVNPLYAFLWRNLPFALQPSKREFLAHDRYLEDKLNEFIDKTAASKAAGSDTEEIKGGKGLLMKKMLAVLQEDQKNGTHADTSSTRSSKLSRQQVINNMKGFFIAGRDTTANTISWAVYLLATHPEKQRRLQKEVDEILGNSDAPSTFEQVEKLVYTYAVFQESLRLRSPVHQLIVKSKKTVTLPSGITHPAGIYVCGGFQSFKERDENFARAADFVPERWLSKEERELQLGDQAAHRPEYMWDFGGGARECPGKLLSRLEAVVCIAGIFKKFEVEPDMSMPPPERVSEFVVMVDAVHVLLKERAS